MITFFLTAVCIAVGASSSDSSSRPAAVTWYGDPVDDTVTIQRIPRTPKCDCCLRPHIELVTSCLPNRSQDVWHCCTTVDPPVTENIVRCCKEELCGCVSYFCYTTPSMQSCCKWFNTLICDQIDWGVIDLSECLDFRVAVSENRCTLSFSHSDIGYEDIVLSFPRAWYTSSMEDTPEEFSAIRWLWETLRDQEVARGNYTGLRPASAADGRNNLDVATPPYIPRGTQLQRDVDEKRQDDHTPQTPSERLPDDELELSLAAPRMRQPTRRVMEPLPPAPAAGNDCLPPTGEEKSSQRGTAI